MKKIVKAIATVAGVATVAWAMRDRFFAIASPKEPEPPKFRVVPMSPSKEGDDLTEIRGVGPVYAARLKDAGFTTIASLAAADPGRVAEVAGVPIEKAEDWGAQATTVHA